MKIFKLIRVSYKNIMSVGDNPIVIELNSCHKTLITGVNGGGKSTMLEAITFALFGKPFRDIKKGQLINSVNKKNLLVTLNLEYNGSSYEIKRGQKPNIFEVRKDGNLLDASASVRDFQSEFEEMIGMNYNSYKQVVVLGTAGFTPFMGLSTGSRRKLVEDLLEVSILADMDKINKDAIRNINSELQQIELKISHNQTQTQTLIAANERQKKLSGDNAKRFEIMLEEKMSELDGIKAGSKVLNEELNKIEMPPDSVIEDCHNAHRKIVQTEGEMNTYSRTLSLYEKGGSCPTCLQQLSDPFLQGKIEHKHDEIKNIFNQLKDEFVDIHSKKVELLKAREMVENINREILNNRQKGIQIIEQIKKIQAAIAESKKDYIDNTSEIDALKSDMIELVNAKSALIVEKHRRSVITEMLKDSGIKGAIIGKYMPLFNKQINHYLNLLEADYSFTLNEEFSETIKSRGREDFSYASFSQGEKGRIDLALMFTWRDVAERISGIKISCLFLDEVFDSAMDMNGSKSISTVLNSMKDTNIFIISHRDHNPQDYGQHLQMKKVGRFTVMES
ncbi:recombination-related endonuclease [Acinetobacter phage AB1I1M-1]